MILFLFCGAWAACSARPPADYAEGGAALSLRSAAASVPMEEDALFNGTADAETAAPAEDAVPAAPEGGRKLIRRAAVRIRAQDPAEAEKAVTAAMEKYGAYAAAAAIDDDTRYFTIRVPAVSYQALLADIGGLGRVLSRSENAEDVTLRYYDLEGRLATKRELLKTFRGYLGRAAAIEDILSVEKRIAELEDEIDGTGRELRTLGNLVDYATVELEVYGPVTSSPYRTPSFGERLLELLDSFGDFVSVLALVLVGIVIFGVPAVLILAVLFWVLFGKIGLLKRLWRAAAGKRTA